MNGTAHHNKTARRVTSVLILARSAALALALTAQTARADDTTLFGSAPGTFIPFVTPINSPDSGLPHVALTFGAGKTLSATMDTGSVGLVVSKDNYTGQGTLIGPGQIVYNSSGIVENGSYYQTTFSFLDARNNQVATTNVPVLVVNTITCLSNARNCQPGPAQGVAQMGVGFGQEAADQPNGIPSVNPFLNVTATASGTLPSKGYMVSRNGVTLGLQASALNGFSLVKLAPYAQYTTARLPEWLLAPANISVNGTAANGVVLADTGVTGMYLTAPAGSTIRTFAAPPKTLACEMDCADPGTTVTISIPGQPGQLAGYSFAVGPRGGKQPGNAVSPVGVSVDSGASAYVNTTLNLFNNFDYLYDEADGFVGFRQRLTSDYASTTPGLTLQGPVALPSGFVSNLPTYLMDYEQAMKTTATGRIFLQHYGIPVQLSAIGGATFNQPLSGPGALEIVSGRVTLAAANTYAGTTQVDAPGTLVLSGAGSVAASTGLTMNGTFDISGTAAGTLVASLSGTGQVHLGSRPLTVVHGGTFSGSIGDGGVAGGQGGSLTLIGGTLKLSGANTYTGGTSVGTYGTLALAGTGSIARSTVSLASGATLDTTAATAPVVGGLSGTGTVRLGSQGLMLAGAGSSFEGTISDGGAGGALILTGGTQMLTGANSHSGGTLIGRGGTLGVTSDAALGASGTPILLDGGALQAQGSGLATTRPISLTAYGGTLDGTTARIDLYGNLNGAGSLSTAGTVGFEGVATVAGALNLGGFTAVEGQLQAGSVTVWPGATLRGTGQIAAPLTVLGMLAPGNSPGTLTVAGPVTLGTGSTTQFDIDGAGTGTGAGNYSRLLVTNGSLTLGGTVAPALRGVTGSATNGYSPNIGQQFTVAAASGGVTGAFARLTQPVGLLSGTRFDVLYGPTAVSLMVTPARYGALGAAGLAQTANEASVGAALDAVRPAAGSRPAGSLGTVLDALYPLSGPAIAPALDGLGAKIYGDALFAGLEQQRLVTDAISDQLATLRGAAPSSQAQITQATWDGTMWVRGLGSWTTQDHDAGARGSTASLSGVAAGADVHLRGGVLAGVTLAYTGATVSSQDGGRDSAQALHLAGYGSWQAGRVFADAMLGGSWTEDRITRTTPVLGQTSQGQRGADGVFGRAEAGIGLTVGRTRMTPAASFTGQTLGRNRANETADAAAALSVTSGEVHSLRSELGARVEQAFVVAGRSVVPTLHVGWSHEFGDTATAVGASFLNLGGPAFATHTAAFGRDGFVGGLGATAKLAASLDVFAAYATDVRPRYAAQSVTGGLRYAW